MSNWSKKGFWPAEGTGKIREFTAGATALKAGDMVYLDSNGLALICTASDAVSCGVVASDTDASGQVPIYCDPNQIFEGQISGSWNQNLVGKKVDIEGATGAQMVDQDATSVLIVTIIDHAPIRQGNDDLTASYVKVHFVIARHQFGNVRS